jgi:3-oxosteroid 1-dehydrogenase
MELPLSENRRMKVDEFDSGKMLAHAAKQAKQRKYDQFLGDPRKDDQFRSLGKIEKAPFYAIDVVPGDVSTYGGVVTDVNSRVLKADGTPIEGLYACGVSTASPMGKIYPGAGASVGPSMAFGWIAAKHAAGLGNQAV